MARQMPPPPAERAFTLVELSIVLVILGLLVGGVLAGQSLIKAAATRKTIAWNTSIQTTFMTFRDKYMAFPGDMPNATSFWNRNNTGVCNSDPGTASATGTCNGNGDGYILWNGGPPGENYLVWHHLYLSGMDPYGQTAGSGGGPWAVYIPTPGQSRSVVSLIGASGSGNANLYGTFTPANAKGVALQTGSVSGCGGPSGVAAKPEDAWQIDTKIDDSLPGTGNFRANGGYLPAAACAAAACTIGSAPGYAYNVTTQMMLAPICSCW